jgi:hypothetical protein
MIPGMVLTQPEAAKLTAQLFFYRGGVVELLRECPATA